MLTLRESALRKSLIGFGSTLDEVVRVTAGGH